MTAAEALQAVQFVTVKGRRFVVLSIEDWETLVEWMEDLEDTQIARTAFAELSAAGGDRQRAGWRTWDEVEFEFDIVDTAQFVVDARGNRQAVLVDYRLWEELLTSLEDQEDAEEIRRLREAGEEAIPWEQAKAELRAKGFDV